MWPVAISCLVMTEANSAGMAKPMPTEPPDSEKMAVFTPTTRPNTSKVGPPELPRLMGASICR